MRILLAGGGSGGHVTPLKAITEELTKEGTDLEITIITDRGFYTESKTIFAEDKHIKLKKIFSGKYRRYTNKSFMWHVIHLPTLLKNIRDVLLLAFGMVQAMSYFLLQKPDVIFCKGGFVCVPIGTAARLFKIPVIIHDSDTRPGLTNRILAKHASVIATGMPTTFYPYSKEKMIYTGIPVNAAYKPVSEKDKTQFKEALGLDSNRPLLLVTGGGNGSVPLNSQIEKIAEQLIDAGWSIVQLAGRGKAAAVKRVQESLPESHKKHWQIEEFASMPPRLLGADIVVCRTSASTIQECANAEKIIVGIASPNLDDQKMNAEFFASKNALVSLDELQLSSDGVDLLTTLTSLHARPQVAQKYAHVLHQEFAKPRAAYELAQLILTAVASS